MATVDILILVGLLLYALLGFRDGFFKKLFGILGILCGLIVATKFMSGLGENIMHWMDLSADVSNVLAFALLFMFSVVAVNLLFRWFGRSSKETLSIRSRFAGAVMGLAQGFVGVSLILLMFNIFEMPSEDEKGKALFYEPMTQIAPIVFDYTTAWMPSSKDFFEEVKSKIEKTSSSQ